MSPGRRPALAAISVACLVLLSACGADRPAPEAPDPAPEPRPDPRPDPELGAVHELAASEARTLGVPGMALGVVRDGELVSVRGYGTSDRAQQIDGETVFRIGSVTKVFTALALLHLRDAGALELDDPVAEHLPELAPVLSADGEEPVRVKHLLRHSSGIPTLGDGSLDWTSGEPIAEKALLASVKNTELGFEPGTASAYSNVGMAIAGLVVARASGTSYRAYVNEHLLEPLGMSSTAWEPEAFEEGRVFPGYTRVGGAYRKQEQPWVFGAVESAGGLYSTARDMARFLAFQADPASVPGVLAADSVAASQTRSASQAGSHGLGWVVQPDPDLGDIVWHSGATYAYGAWAGLDPARDHGVVVFVSTGHLPAVSRAGELGKDALRVLAGLEPTYTAEAAEAPDREPTDPEVIEEVSQRVRELLNAPGEAELEAVFSRAFLERKPAASLRRFLETAHGQIGACERHELLEDTGGGRFVVKMSCEKTNIEVTLAAGAEPPHLLDGFLIQLAE